MPTGNKRKVLHLRRIKMKSFFYQFLLILALFLVFTILFPSCQTYQIGGTIEPRPGLNALGVFFAGDWIDDKWEDTLVYFPEANGIGNDFLFKYPFHFAGNHFSVFPMLGTDLRYFWKSSSETNEYRDGIYENIFENFGFGIKLGVGFDITFTKELFMRGKMLYSPEILSFLRNEPGFRFSLSIGYRTEDDTVRKGFKSFKAFNIDNALKAAKENFDKKDYNGAVVNYNKAINLGASLGNTGVSNLSTAYYELAKQNRDKGNYNEALDNLNSSMRHQYLMNTQKYSDWLSIIERYEKTNDRKAPHYNSGKLVFPLSDNLTINYDKGENEQTNPNEILGNGSILNLPVGRRVFSLTYDEPFYNRGNRKSDVVRVTLNVEEGHIYRAEGNVSGSQVIITIVDVTNSELNSNLDISPNPIFSRTMPLREVKPKLENISINIVNNTGYTIASGGFAPVVSTDTSGDDIHIFNLGGNIRSGYSRKVTLPEVDTNKVYFIMLMDTDGDVYAKIVPTIIPNMTITFTISDFYKRK
jgi:tetratricopeptide (TPR) repeat protein